MSASVFRFLVPIDFSRQSLVVLEQASNLAKYYNADVVLLHVVEDIGLLSKIFTKKIDERELANALEAKLKKLARDMAVKMDVNIEAVVKHGTVYDKILETAESFEITMIVMSALESSGLKKRFIASNTLRVVKQSPCPVITVKGRHHRDGCKNLILPLDMTKGTKQKITHAIEFTKVFNDTKIWIVSVLKTPKKELVEDVASKLEEVKLQIENKGIDCSAAIVKIIKGEDSVPQAIIDYAEKANGDCIVMMTQQEEEPIEHFLDAIPQFVINNSEIPVMSIVPMVKRIKSVF